MCKALGITKQKQTKKTSKKRNCISADESDSISNESDNKKAKLTKKEKAEAKVIHQPPKFPPPLHAQTSPPRVSPIEVTDQQEAANAMLLLGTAATKKQNGPLKKRHTSSLLNNTGSMSSAFQFPPPAKSFVPSVQLDDFVTGSSWKITPPLGSLAQLIQSSQMTRQRIKKGSDHHSKVRSYLSGPACSTSPAAPKIKI